MEFFHFCNGLCYNWQEAITLNSFHIIPFYWVVWSLFSIKDLKEFRNGFFFCPAISFSCRALGGYFSRTPILVQRMEIGIPVFGMPLRIYQKRGVYGRQFVLRNGRLDILGIDTAGDLYVIELKKDSGYDDAYAQTREYIDWIEEDVAVKGQRVFGIICLNDPTKDLIEKVKADDQMRLFEYSISYSEII